MGKTIVVTGSSRGLGFGLAQAFLAKGCNVVLSGRSRPSLDDAAAKLRAPDRVLSVACDAGDAASVRALWEAALARFGRVDVWINNAGAGSSQRPFLEQPVSDLAEVARTNLVGTVLGTRIALEGMQRQGFGQVFNLEGFGSNPRVKRSGMAVYGATKAATRYFTQSVAKELKGSKVQVGTLSPGVVVTGMLIHAFDGLPRSRWEKAKKLYNKLADPVETVAPFLADAVLNNTKNGATIAWINPLQMLLRIASPFRTGRNVFEGQPEPRVV